MAADHATLLDSPELQEHVRNYSDQVQLALNDLRRRVRQIAEVYDDGNVPFPLPTKGAYPEAKRRGADARTVETFAATVNELCSDNDLSPVFGTCPHETTRTLYDQRPPSEGRGFRPIRKLCEDCGHVLPHPNQDVTP